MSWHFIMDIPYVCKLTSVKMDLFAFALERSRTGAT